MQNGQEEAQSTTPAASTRYWNSNTFVTLIALFRIFDSFKQDCWDNWVPQEFNQLYKDALNLRHIKTPPWRSFLDQFVSYEGVKAVKAMLELAKSHMEKHGITFEDKTKPPVAPTGARQTLWWSIMEYLNLMTAYQVSLLRESLGSRFQLGLDIISKDFFPLPTIREVQAVLEESKKPAPELITID